MNTTTTTTQTQTENATSTPRSLTAQSVVAHLIRREHRARDYGVGYGSSSGYASGRRYADNWGNVRFQCG